MSEEPSFASEQKIPVRLAVKRLRRIPADMDEKGSLSEDIASVWVVQDKGLYLKKKVIVLM